MPGPVRVSLQEALALVTKAVGKEKAPEELLQKLRRGEISATAEEVVARELTGMRGEEMIWATRNEDRNVVLAPAFWIEQTRMVDWDRSAVYERNLKIEWDESAVLSPANFGQEHRFRDPLTEVVVTGIHLKRSDVVDIWPAEAQDTDALSYITPYIKLMLEAIEHFNIRPSGRNPKKDELVAWFLQKTLPNGTPISRNQAENMATFSRPPEMARGGNSKV